MAYQVQPLPTYLQQAYDNDPSVGMSQSLIQSGMSSAPVGSWSQGLGRLAQTLAGVYGQNKAKARYQGQAQDYRQQLTQALASPNPTAFLSQSSNPQLQDMGLQFQLAQAQKTPAVSYQTVSPDEAKQLGLDPRGTYQRSSTGQISVLNQPKQPIIQDGFVIDPNDPTHPQQIPGYLQQKEALAAASRAPTQAPETWSTVNGPDGKPLYQQSNRGERKAAVGTGADQFGGTGLDAQAWNVVIGAATDPKVASTPQYAAAYQILAQPKVTLDQQTGNLTTITPDMSKFPKPSFAGPSPAPGGQQPIPSGTAGGLPAPQGALPAPQPPTPQGAPAGMPPAQQIAPGVTVQHAMPPAPKPLTEDQAKSAQLFDRVQQQLPIVMKNFDALSGFADRATSIAPDQVRGYLQSPEYQQADNALTDLITSYLYSVSGATANPGEVATLKKTVTPLPGEPAASIADKKARIAEMANSIGRRMQAAGNAPAGPTDYKSKYGLQ